MKLEAVLVALNISRFSNQRRDESITQEVKALHSLTGNAGRWIKFRLDPDAFDEIQHVCSQARQAHYRLTLAWEPGRRLLPLKGKTRYSEEMARIRDRFNQAVNEFVEKYPAHVEWAREMHKAKFDASQYPAPGDGIRAEFNFAVDYAPVPAAAHFNDLLSGGALEEMREGLKAANEARLNTATTELWERILSPVQRIASILSQDAVRGGKCPTFRDSLFENVREVIDEAESLNVTNCPRVGQALSEIKLLIQHRDTEAGIQHVRDNYGVRRYLAEEANRIATAFGVGTRVVDTEAHPLDETPTTYTSRRKIIA